MTDKLQGNGVWNKALMLAGQCTATADEFSNDNHAYVAVLMRASYEIPAAVALGIINNQPVDKTWIIKLHACIEVTRRHYPGIDIDGAADSLTDLIKAL